MAPLPSWSWVRAQRKRTWCSCRDASTTRKRGAHERLHVVIADAATGAAPRDASDIDAQFTREASNGRSRWSGRPLIDRFGSRRGGCGASTAADVDDLASAWSRFGHRFGPLCLGCLRFPPALVFFGA